MPICSNNWWIKRGYLFKKILQLFGFESKKFCDLWLNKGNIDEEYNDALTRFSKGDKFYNIKYSSKETQRKNFLDSFESLNKKTKRMKRKRTVIYYLERKGIA